MSDIEPSETRPRILLVDDTALNREIIGRILEAAGYDVDLASNGEEAVEATWSKAYGLVLMDIEMPGMNGFEAAARIRAREGVMSGVKIAALTATQQPDAEIFSFWSGIDTFIPKPIEPKRLLARVATLVTEAAGAGGNDWKPVWRLAVFARFAAKLDHDEAESMLDAFSALLDTVAAAIDAKNSQLFSIIQKLSDRAALMGFEELAGICALVEDQREMKGARCRDPNLLGAISRAGYAIDVYRREQATAPRGDLWARMRINVQSLFKGARPEAAVTHEYRAGNRSAHAS